ncbi:MAG: hypothetical protein Kow0032_02100 [Methyloligellaceae bacterium]
MKGEAALRLQQLGILDPCRNRIRVQHHRGRDHRPGPWSAARLVNAGDGAAVAPGQGQFQGKVRFPGSSPGASICRISMSTHAARVQERPPRGKPFGRIATGRN